MDKQQSPSPEVLIEPARVEDAVSIVSIQKKTWLATYPNEQAGITKADLRERLEGAHGELVDERIRRWEERLTTQGGNAIFVARLDGQVVGYSGARVVDGQRQISTLYVLPEAQGLGLGGRLLRRAIEWHHQQAPQEPIFVHVVSYNENAIGVYGHYGFEKTGVVVTDEVAKLPSGAVIPEIEMKLSKTSTE